MGVEAPDWQGVETQEYLLYFKFSQRSQAGQGESPLGERGSPGGQGESPLGERGSPGGWIGGQNCEFILKPALSPHISPVGADIAQQICFHKGFSD
jgi:hypothetical protein